MTNEDRFAALEDCVIVPRSELARVEAARVALINSIPSQDIGKLIALGKFTEPLWQVANRNWPAADTLCRDYQSEVERLTAENRRLQHQLGELRGDVGHT